MPRPSKGVVRIDREGKYASAQFTFPKQIPTNATQPRRVTIPLSPGLHADKPAADKRAQEMNAWLQQTQQGTSYEAAHSTLVRMGLAETALALTIVTQSSTKLLDPARSPDVQREKTYREAALLWLNGDVEKLTSSGEYGKQIRTPVAAKIYRTRFENYVFPFVGDLPLSAVNATTLKPVRAVIAEDPIVSLKWRYGKFRMHDGRWHLDPTTQRDILGMCSRLLTICARLGWLTCNPLPPGWLPEAPPQKNYQQVLPDLYVKLMAKQDVSVHRRLLWGFMRSYGLRGPSEVKPLTIEQFDLDNCGARAWSSKVKKHIMFALDKGDALAFKRYLAKYRPNAKPTDKMFVEDDHPLGLRPNFRFSEELRRDLRLVGAPESLLDGAKDLEPLRSHDAGRATFVTQSLIKGKSDGQIRAVTKHTSVKMMERYNRQAESLAQFVLMRIKNLPTLDKLIPELRASAGAGRKKSASAARPVRRRSAARSPRR